MLVFSRVLASQSVHQEARQTTKCSLELVRGYIPST